MSVRVRVAALLSGLALSVFAPGCGESDGADESSSTPSTASTTTTQPPASDLHAVRLVIEDLLSDYDEVTAEALANPQLAEDPEAAIREDLERVFSAEALQAQLGVYASNASEGRSLQPLGPEPMFVTTLWGELTAPVENTVEGLVCTTYHYRSVAPDSGEVKDGLSHPGRVYAVREDGEWKVARVDEDESQVCDPWDDIG